MTVYQPCYTPLGFWGGFWTNILPKANTMHRDSCLAACDQFCRLAQACAFAVRGVFWQVLGLTFICRDVTISILQLQLAACLTVSLACTCGQNLSSWLGKLPGTMEEYTMGSKVY